MKAIPILIKAEAQSNYCLYLEFADGVSGTVDLSDGKERVFLNFGMTKVDLKTSKSPAIIN